MRYEGSSPGFCSRYSELHSQLTPCAVYLFRPACWFPRGNSQRSPLGPLPCLFLNFYSAGESSLKECASVWWGSCTSWAPMEPMWAFTSACVPFLCIRWTVRHSNVNLRLWASLTCIRVFFIHCGEEPGADAQKCLPAQTCLQPALNWVSSAGADSSLGWQSRAPLLTSARTNLVKSSWVHTPVSYCL